MSTCRHATRRDLRLFGTKMGFPTASGCVREPCDKTLRYSLFIISFSAFCYRRQVCRFPQLEGTVGGFAEVQPVGVEHHLFRNGQEAWVLISSRRRPAVSARGRWCGRLCSRLCCAAACAGIAVQPLAQSRNPLLVEETEKLKIQRPHWGEARKFFL